jgi:hypothetical protein
VVVGVGGGVDVDVMVAVDVGGMGVDVGVGWDVSQATKINIANAKMAACDNFLLYCIIPPGII